MITDIHIPYGFGDCVKGYKYDGVILSKEYAKQMVSEYNAHKFGIDEMMKRQFTNNIARNSFNKEKRKYKQMDTYFGILRAYLDTKDYTPMTLDELLGYYENDKGFPIVIRIKDRRQLEENPDLFTDLKSWQRECVRIDKLPISETEKFKSLSKKDLKLSFGDDNKMCAVLKDCKMVTVYTNMKFALWVDKIIFYKDKQDEK